MGKLSSTSRANMEIHGGFLEIIMTVMIIAYYLALKAILHPYFWFSDKLKEKRIGTASFEGRHEFL